MSRRSMTRDIHESIRLILGKHAKILLKVPVKLEKGGDKTENRILVFTAHRLFVMIARVPSRYVAKFLGLHLGAVLVEVRTTPPFKNKRFSINLCLFLVFSLFKFQPGDCVALFMENRPEYVGLWLGCTKIGIVPALINTNLQGQPLIHSIKAASAAGLIFGTELEDAVYGVAKDLPNVKLYKSGLLKNGLHSLSSSENRMLCIDKLLEKSSSKPIPESVQNQLNFTDKMLYIYTSGTTGLPKAAVIKHSR